jgi:cytochrome c-type biogenesis protein CcmH/NrfG
LHRPASQPAHEPQQRADILARRARRLRQKGELRRAAIALREACALFEGNAARWMMLGHLHVRLGNQRDAERAMKQALYLREQGGERRKAQVIRRLLSRLNDAAA